MTTATKSPEKVKARRAVRTAIEKGLLVRPNTCQRCCKIPIRGVVHGHHYKGYDHPLDVEWLCSKCHVAEDGSATGKDNGQAMLTDQQVEAVRSARASGGRYWGAQIWAEKFGVHRTTIERAARLETYPDAIRLLSQEPQP